MKMNKLLIPTILAATIVIAGFFAFSPIEKATTVHTTITGQLMTIGESDTVSATTTTDLITDSTLVKSGHVCIEYTDNTTATTGATAANLFLQITDAGDVIQLLDNDVIDDVGGACSNFTGFRLFVGSDANSTSDTYDAVFAYKVENT